MKQIKYSLDKFISSKNILHCVSLKALKDEDVFIRYDDADIGSSWSQFPTVSLCHFNSISNLDVSPKYQF